MISPSDSFLGDMCFSFLLEDSPKENMGHCLGLHTAYYVLAKENMDVTFPQEHGMGDMKRKDKRYYSNY